MTFYFSPTFYYGKSSSIRRRGHIVLPAVPHSAPTTDFVLATSLAILLLLSHPKTSFRHRDVLSWTVGLLEVRPFSQMSTGLLSHPIHASSESVTSFNPLSIPSCPPLLSCCQASIRPCWLLETLLLLAVFLLGPIQPFPDIDLFEGGRTLGSLHLSRPFS